MRMSCPCNRVLPADPEVVGFQRGERGRILGIMYNCGHKSSHILLPAEFTCTLIDKAVEAENRMFWEAGAR